MSTAASEVLSAPRPLLNLAAAAAPRTIMHAAGDGVGPEISEGVLRVLEAAGAPLAMMPVELGLRALHAGAESGVPGTVWKQLQTHGVLLKGPLTTPQGSGMKSVNVTLRKQLGLFANVRPVVSLPQWSAVGQAFDVVVIRENEEDTYAGIEHRQTPEVAQCLKLMTRPGCERIVRYAFEYARSHGRVKVTCMTKDNIMKHTDGLFHAVFREIAEEYPEIDSEHMIVDIGMARLATRPQHFDVLVMPNLYGDIASDLLAELSGSVGLAASANLGASVAMFEAIHGSAPDIAGRDIANPGGLLQAACMMLEHLGHTECARIIRAALLRTLEEGIHTVDIYRHGLSQRRVGTARFAEAVADRLGELPREISLPSPAQYAIDLRGIVARSHAARGPSRTLRGVDVFVHWDRALRDPATLASTLQGQLSSDSPWALEVITNRGVRVWPGDATQTLLADHWRCRFAAADGDVQGEDVVNLLHQLVTGGLDVIKTENLYEFAGEPGYSTVHGA